MLLLINYVFLLIPLKCDFIHSVKIELNLDPHKLKSWERLQPPSIYRLICYGNDLIIIELTSDSTHTFEKLNLPPIVHHPQAIARRSIFVGKRHCPVLYIRKYAVVLFPYQKPPYKH